jgi:hypothetical protein
LNKNICYYGAQKKRGIRVRVFKNVSFSRFARKENISDAVLLEAVLRAKNGQIDADLGGGVIKQRIARQGEGKRGGYRTLVLYRAGERAFFVYGFAKNDQDNIDDARLSDMKTLAAVVLNLPEAELKKLLECRAYTEVL